MPNNKKNFLEKKQPFNLSIKRYIVESFEEYCLINSIDKSAMIESMMLDVLKPKINNGKFK